MTQLATPAAAPVTSADAETSTNHTDHADGAAAPAVATGAAPVALRIESMHTHDGSPEAAPGASGASTQSEPAPDPVIQIQNVDFYYTKFRAVKDVRIAFAPKKITALIGPSGCGKSTLLRTINRMNDLIPGARVEGSVLYHGVNLYDSEVDAVEVRRRIGPGRVPGSRAAARTRVDHHFCS